MQGCLATLTNPMPLQVIDGQSFLYQFGSHKQVTARTAGHTLATNWAQPFRSCCPMQQALTPRAITANSYGSMVLLVAQVELGGTPFKV